MLSNYCACIHLSCSPLELLSILWSANYVCEKAEHLYRALHGIQTTLKRSGMEHTAFNLQRTPCQLLPRKRSPDGASTEWIFNCSPLLIYRPREDERLSWPGWLTYSGRLTHISGHPSATDRAQDGERTLARDWRSTTELCWQFNIMTTCPQRHGARWPEFLWVHAFVEISSGIFWPLWRHGGVVVECWTCDH